MTRTALVSIDPGLDRAAAALWCTTGWNPVLAASSVTEAAKHLRGVFQCVTKPTDAMPARLAQLSDWACYLSGEVRALLELANHIPLSIAPCSVVIEWPAFQGLYHGRVQGRTNRVQPNAASMAGLYAATGAIVAGVSRWCAPERITMAPAARVARELKQLTGRKVIEASTLNGRAPQNDDARSAVFIGLSS